MKNYHVRGLSTNLSFLHTLATHPAFIAAELDTGFIETHMRSLLPTAEDLASIENIHTNPEYRNELFLATMYTAINEHKTVVKPSGGKHTDPWSMNNGHRLGMSNEKKYIWEDAESQNKVNVTLTWNQDTYKTTKDISDITGVTITVEGQYAYRITQVKRDPSGETTVWATLTTSKGSEEMRLTKNISKPKGSDFTYVGHSQFKQVPIGTFSLSGKYPFTLHSTHNQNRKALEAWVPPCPVRSCV